MFVATMLNYTDRQAMALVGPQIKEEFGLLNEGFGWVLSAFSLSYALFQVPAGYLVDRWNIRWAYAGAVAWWSLAGMATAFAPGLGVLMALRALLGVGEAFNWPCALRVTSIVLPPGDRGLGNGIFNSGAAVGAILTPLIVPILTAAYGWRTAFLVIGVAGFVWICAWLAIVGRSRSHLFAGRSRDGLSRGDKPLKPGAGLPVRVRIIFGSVFSLAALVALSAFWLGMTALWWGITLAIVGPLVAALAIPQSELGVTDWTSSLGEIVRLRRFWVLAVVSITVNACWHFLVNWLPTYLKEDRQMTDWVTLVRQWSSSLGVEEDPQYLASGVLTALIFLAADCGNLGGGTLSMWLARRGMNPTRARAQVMMACALLISSGSWVGIVRNDHAVIALLAIMALTTAAFMANYFAFCQEVSARHTGLIVGYLGALGNLFVAGILPIAGRVKDVTGGFGPVFAIVGFLPLVGVGVLVLGWRREPSGLKPS